MTDAAARRRLALAKGPGYHDVSPPSRQETAEIAAAIKASAYIDAKRMLRDLRRLLRLQVDAYNNGGDADKRAASKHVRAVYRSVRRAADSGAQHIEMRRMQSAHIHVLGDGIRHLRGRIEARDATESLLVADVWGRGA